MYITHIVGKTAVSLSVHENHPKAECSMFSVLVFYEV